MELRVLSQGAEGRPTVRRQALHAKKSGRQRDGNPWGESRPLRNLQETNCREHCEEKRRAWRSTSVQNRLLSACGLHWWCRDEMLAVVSPGLARLQSTWRYRRSGWSLAQLDADYRTKCSRTAKPDRFLTLRRCCASS